MSQDNEFVILKPRLKTVGRGHSLRPNTSEHPESSSNLRRPRFGSNNGDLPSTTDYKYNEGRNDGLSNSHDQENWRLKGELEITRRLLLLNNSAPRPQTQSNQSTQSFSPEQEQEIFYDDEEEDLDSVSTREVKLSPPSFPPGPAGDAVSREELQQLHSKLDKVMEMVAANNGSSRSAVSASTSFYDNLERQLSTPPPSLSSIPPSYSHNYKKYADNPRDSSSVYSNYKPSNGVPTINQPLGHSGYKLPHAASSNYDDNRYGTSSNQRCHNNLDERAPYPPYGNQYDPASYAYRDMSNGHVRSSTTNGCSEWSGNNHYQDPAWKHPAGFDGIKLTRSADGYGREYERCSNQDGNYVQSGAASSRFKNSSTSFHDQEETEDADLEMRKEQEMILKQIYADRERKQMEEALSLKYIQEIQELPDLTADMERKKKEEALSMKYIQERPDLSKPPPVVTHLRDQRFKFERSDNDYPPLAGSGDQNDWHKVTKPKKIPASQKLASVKIAEDLEKKRKDDLAIKEWHQTMITREQKEKERIVQHVEEANKVKFVRDVESVIKESRPLNNRAQSLSAAPLGDVIPQPRAEKKALKKRRNQSESQASNAAFEIERRKAAVELKLRLEKQVANVTLLQRYEQAHEICWHPYTLSYLFWEGESSLGTIGKGTRTRS